MVKLRLQRFGRTHRPYYRLGAVDARAKRNGEVIEELGAYDPMNKNVDDQIKFNKERCEYWLGVGAQPTDTVADLLRKIDLGPKAKK